MFIIVSGSLTKKSLFEGAHKRRKRKTLNHSAYLSSLFAGGKGNMARDDDEKRGERIQQGV